ncbi:hypothetical protein ACHQM5_016016 [Ranunculus cassubicifolius]
MVTPPASPIHNESQIPSTGNSSSTVDNVAALPFKKVDPYFIHPSDSPAIVFYQPLLQGDDYQSWLRGISKALNAKGKLGFVDGSLPPPTDPLEFSCWKRCDDLVCSWILNSVIPEIRSSCLYADCALTIWKDLHSRFSQSNAPKLYQLKTAISNLKQEDMSVTTYFTRLKSLWDELDSILPTEQCICGTGKAILERIAKDRAIEFMQGLHDRFAPIRSQILLIEPMPTAEKIFSLVKQEESQQAINNNMLPTIDSAALQIQSPYGRSSRASSQKRQRPFCDHCNRYGHTKTTCYQLNGYPPKSGPSSHRSHSQPPHFHNNGVAAAASSSIAAPSQALPNFTAEQYQRLLALLNSPTADDGTAKVNNLTGPHHEDSDW